MREGQQLEHGHSPCHALGNALHQGGFLRASQQPAALAARRRIDAAADIGQKLRRVLDLVEDGRKSQTIKEATRVIAHLPQGVRIFEQAIVRLRPHQLQQSGLAAAPWTREQQGSKAAAGSLGNGDQQAGCELAHDGQI